MRRAILLCAIVSACAASKPAIYGAELASCEAAKTACEYVDCCRRVAEANGRDPAQACALELCPSDGGR